LKSMGNSSYFLIQMINTPTRTTKSTNKAEIQTGEKTHHQLQLITPVSFSTIKTMVSNPTNPMPPPL
jgi:hypothetical protein